MAKKQKQDRTIYRVRYVFEGEDMTEDFCYDPWDKMAYDEAFFTYLAMFRGDIDDAEIEITDPKWDRHLTLPYKRSDYSGLVCSCDMDGYDQKDYTLDSFGQPQFAGYGIKYCPNCGRFVSHYDMRYFDNTMEYEPECPVWFPNGRHYKNGDLVED